MIIEGNIYNYLTGEFRSNGSAPAIAGWVKLKVVPDFPKEFWKWDGSKIIDSRIN